MKNRFEFYLELSFRSFGGEIIGATIAKFVAEISLRLRYSCNSHRRRGLSIYRVTRFDTDERLESICKIPRVTVRKVSERGNGVQSTRENEVFNDILKTLYNRDYRH